MGGGGAVYKESIKTIMKTYLNNSLEYKLLQRRNLEYRKKLSMNATKAELVFKDFLNQNSIYYKFQKGFLKPFHRIVDFYIPYVNVIIEIDGEIHNLLKNNDSYKDSSFLKERNFNTIRIKNSEIFDNSFKNRFDIINLLKSAPTKAK